MKRGHALALAVVLPTVLMAVGCSGQALITPAKAALAGGALGASAGAIIGAAVSHPGVGAVIGGGVGVAYVLAHVALIEVGREVAVVNEPTPTGNVQRARLWIVDEGGHSWIHPGNANAQWWVRHMDANSIVDVERGGEVRRYRATPDPQAHAKVHRLLREKYGIADVWVRFLSGTNTKSGLLSWGKTCTTVPIRLQPVETPPK